MQMDEVTQQNAALVEENTAAAQSLLEQARSLETLVSFFKVDETQVSEAPAAEPVKSNIVPMKPAAKTVKPASKIVRKPVANGANGKAHPVLAGKTLLAASGKQQEQGWEEF